MNILLPTYSYHPYNFGGTETYVSGLAGYLIKQGHSVIVIASMPPRAFQDHAVFYEDNEICTLKYTVHKITVIGVINKNTSTEELYTKSKAICVKSWLNVLDKLPQRDWHILHFHAFTYLIGSNILNAVRQKFIGVKVIASYHLSISCTKNTLMYGNTLSECTIAPSANECTACVINSSRKIPLFAAKILTRFMPLIKPPWAPLSLKLKYLVGRSVHAFNEFDASIDQWHVFSNQIRQILLLNKILPQKIVSLKHGVDEIFLQNQLISQILVQQREKQATVFLYVGRFEKEKGILTLLKSWCGLEDSAIRRLEIIGEMLVMDEELNNWIRISSKRKDIQWYGQQTPRQIASIMQGVHCTIIPSECVEIGPLVFHEAISSGTDVIASDIGGCKELSVLYSKKSTLFRAGNSLSLRQAILNFNYSYFSYQPLSQNENYRNVLSHYLRLLSVS